MRRLFLYCLISLPLWANAEPQETAQIPPPPQLSAEDNAPPEAEQNQANAPRKTTADDAVPPVAQPEAPDLPMPVQSGENLEPDITIIRRGEETIQEYRHNGEIYMVKVIPDVGPPYYLVDTNNDGKLDVQRSDLDRGLKVNLWKIFEWK